MVFVGAFGTALLLHLNAPSARRAIAAFASDAASRELRGRVEVVSIDKLSPRALDIGEITLRDPSGRPVASVYGAHLRYDALALASAVFRKGTPTIDRIVVERINVALIPNDEGVPTLVDAIALRNPQPAKGPGEKTPSTFRMALPAIDVRTLEVFGEAAGKWIGAHGEIEKVSVNIAPEATSVAAPRIAVDLSSGHAPAETSIEISGAMRIPTHGSEGELPVLIDRAEVRLSSAGAHATITATADGHTYDAHVEIPTVAPAVVAAITGAPPPAFAPASATFDVHGTMDLVEVHGVANVGSGAAAIDATVDLTAFDENPSKALPRVGLGEARVSLRGIDPASFGGPSMPISTDFTARATATERGTEVTLAADGGAAIEGKPATFEIDATAMIAPNKSIDASGTAHAKLGGANADVTFSVALRGTAGTAHATMAGSAPALEELAAIHKSPISGRVDLEGAIDVDLRKQTFAATARAHAIGFRHPSVAVPEGAIAVQAEGPFSEPKFVAAVVARQLVLSPANADPHRLHDVDLRIAGTPKLIGVAGKLSTDAGQNVALSTHFAPSTVGARVIGTKLRIERGTFIAEVAVKDVSLDRGVIRVEGFRMSSTAGGLRLDAKYDPKRHELNLDAASTPLDLPALLHGAGLEDLGIKGTLIVDAKLATIARKPLSASGEAGILGLDDAPRPTTKKKAPGDLPYLTGHLKFDLDDGFAKKIGDINAHVDVDVEDRLVAGDVGFSIKNLIRVGLNGAALVDGRLDDPGAWMNASGRVDLRVPRVDLAKVTAFLQKTALFGPTPPRLAGFVDIDGHIERRGKNAPPTGWVSLDTHGFGMVSGNTTVEGIDLRFRAALDGAHDKNGALDPTKPVKVYAVAEARDNKGPLAVVHAGTEGAWEKLRAAGSALTDLPLTLDVIVLPRDLDLYPHVLSSALPVHGKLGLMGRGTGTVGAPKIELRARLEDITGTEGTVHDADLTLTYDGAVGKLMTAVAARRDPTKKLLSLDGEVKVRAADVLAGGVIPWTAKLDAAFDGMPIDLLVADTGVSGKAKGAIHLDHINDPNVKAADVDGRIDIEKLTVGDAVFDETYLMVRVDEQAANASAVVHGKDGHLDATLKVPLAWKNAASPSIAPGAAIEATLDAKDLRLKIAEPFVPQVDALDGKLNARITASVTKKSDGHYQGAPEGTITLREGLVIVDAVGERWEHVAADVKLADNKLALPKLELRGRTGGRAKVSGYATFDGFFPETFHVQIDTKRFPFSQEGAKVGDVSGTIKVDGKQVPLPDGREKLVIEVTPDPLTIDLDPAAGKEVQSLDNDPSIIVHQPIGPRIAPPQAAGEGKAVKISVHLPHSVWVRREDLRIALTGNQEINIDGLAKLGGELRVDANPASNLMQRSWVEVAGKRFYIQQSRIALQGNEDFDPKLDIEARWQAPDRTIVQVRITGNLSTPRISFKALDESGAPLGLTQGEVMSLLVLGRRDAGSSKMQKEAEKGAASQAASLVSGMTQAIFGKQLQKWLPAAISISFAPGRYSGGYQLENIYFEVAYNSAGARMGPQAIGQTVPRTTFGIEWRFHRMFSLMTTIGDTGSALIDLLWHYRY